MRNEWKHHWEIISYCIMPDHFHFMLVPAEKKAAAILNLGDTLSQVQNLSKSIGQTLSSYTKAVNIQNETTGNLFQKKLKPNV